MITIYDFLSDNQGKRFKDVAEDQRICFEDIIKFFNRPDILKRLEDSELHHKRPALAGVIVEMERIKTVNNFFTTNDAHTTVRFRQAVGVLVKLHMLQNGWTTTNVKGSLGTRNPKLQYENNDKSLSRWFSKAERYIKCSN